MLLAKRSPSRAGYPGLWDVPGGRSEGRETPGETLVRELTEELGVILLHYRELAVLPATGAALLAFHLYRVTQWRGTPRNLQPAEHTEITWVALAEVAALELAVPAYPALFASAHA